MTVTGLLSIHQFTTVQSGKTVQWVSVQYTATQRVARHTGKQLVQSRRTIEVMSRFVNHQPTRIVLVAVPATKVVSPVDSVKQPLKVNRLDFADSTIHNKLLDLGCARSVAVVERHAETLARLLDRV